MTVQQRLIMRYITGAVGVLLTLGVWQGAATIGPLSRSALPTALDSISTGVQLMSEAATWAAIGSTLVMALTGLVAAIIVGVLLGMVIGISPIIQHATRVPLEFLKPIPPIVVMPVVVLALGPSAQMGIMLVFLGSFVAIAVQSAAGVFDVDPIARATGQSYGLSSVEIFRRVLFPSALPYIGTAVRVAAPTALVIAVVAGLLGGGPGLGQSLLLAQLGGNQTRLFGYVLILGVLGLIVQALSQWGERTLLHWHPQYRKESN